MSENKKDPEGPFSYNYFFNVQSGELRSPVYYSLYIISYSKIKKYFLFNSIIYIISNKKTALDFYIQDCFIYVNFRSGVT